MDILPCDDPNLFTVNMQGKGRLPIAILASEEYDITQIDAVSLHIGEATFPVRVPVIDKDDNGDGLPDLKIHYSRRDVIAALGLDTMEPGTVVPITVEGLMNDGRVVFGTDNVVLVARED